MKRAGLMTAAAVIALIAGLLTYGLYRNATRQIRPEALQALMDESLASPSGAPVRIASWRGKVILVNFWATWCAPCKEEIPLLAQMQSELGARGLQVVGIAIDNPDNVRQFLPSSPINYAVAVASTDMFNTVRGLGDHSGSIPYSLVLNRSGEVSAQKLGAFRREELKRELERALH